LIRLIMREITQLVIIYRFHIWTAESERD